MLLLTNGLECAVLVQHQQLLQLLLKASQDKRFVCEEADRALGSMVSSMTPLPLLQKLRVYVSHKNLRVRAKAAASLSTCVSKMVSRHYNHMVDINSFFYVVVFVPMHCSKVSM